MQCLIFQREPRGEKNVSFGKQMRRVLEFNDCTSYAEFYDKFNTTASREEMSAFMSGKIPARFQPPLLGRCEVRKSPLL